MILHHTDRHGTNTEIMESNDYAKLHKKFNEVKAELEAVGLMCISDEPCGNGLNRKAYFASEEHGLEDLMVIADGYARNLNIKK
jgi:hypothetical protein